MIIDAKVKYKIAINLIASILLVTLTGEYDGTRLGIIETLEKQSYDWRLQNEEPQKRQDIAIIDIDRDTLRAYGNWPFERNLFAKLNEQLISNYRVRMVGYALPFSRSDDTALTLLDNFEKGLAIDNANLNYEARQLLKTLRGRYNFDKQVVRSMQGQPIVLGHSFDATGRVEGELPPPAQFLDYQRRQPLQKKYLRGITEEWTFFNGYAGNLESYLSASGDNAGHINMLRDADGIVRRSPYFIQHANAYYLSLPLAMYQRLQREKEIFAETAGDKPDAGAFKRFTLGSRDILLNKRGNMHIRYLGRGGRNVDFENTPTAVFAYHSFSDVAEGKVAAEALDDKIVLVGSSSEQLRLLAPTPLNGSLPLVEILATQLANILDNNILHRASDAPLKEILLLLLLMAALSIVFAFAGPIISVAVVLATIAAHVYFVLGEWNDSNNVWTLTPTILSATMLLIVHTIVGFIFEWRSNRQLQNTFGQYVPPEVAKRLSATSGDINLEGEGRVLSVLFSDIRNFTSISEKLTPRELTLLLNRILTALSEVIHKHGGTVDKYIGDAIMAFWNAPLYDEQHATKSVLAAMDMQAELAKLSDELVSKGFTEKIALGAGICTGEANVGNMGSNLRMAYTAIGDTVNLSSRTESLTKFYGCAILVTETTYAQCKNIAFRAVDLVRVKGRSAPVLLYTPLGAEHSLLPGDIAREEQFERMRQFYVSGDFINAAKELEAYKSTAPDDPLIQIYEQRLLVLLESPPPNWDGVMTHESK